MTADTPQQKHVLRNSKTAQAVRRRFPAGTRVMGAPGVYGTVVRHIPMYNAQGGTIVVQWDNPPFGDGRGRHSASH